MLLIGGRKVKVQTGTHTQTVNICTARNIHGEYDYILRLRPPFTSEDELLNQGFDSIAELVDWLKVHHHAALEKSPVQMRPAPGQPAVVAAAARPLSAWEQEAVRLVEEGIDALVRGFIRNPYLHRVEHSLHCELYRLLKANKLFSDEYPLGRGMTQCVHKEWPEWRTRPEKGNRRGTYDLAVVSPEALMRASLDDFLDGRIEPLLAVEIGLDYRYDHLRDDDAKLTNSGLRRGYLVHLAREGVVDDYDAVERLVLASRHRTAYARSGYRQTAWKLLGDTAIQYHRDLR